MTDREFLRSMHIQPDGPANAPAEPDAAKSDVISATYLEVDGNTIAVLTAESFRMLCGAVDVLARVAERRGGQVRQVTRQRNALIWVCAVVLGLLLGVVWVR